MTMVEQPWRCRSRRPRFLGVLEAATVGAGAVAVAAVGFEQLFDEAGRLHAI